MTSHHRRSTTANRDVAASFAGKQHPLLFKYETKDFMCRGADIGFLSVYPQEEEFLYPPLTYLSTTVVKVEDINGVEVIVSTVDPSFPS